VKRTSCSRAYEVEALRDGRLTGTARENFERHLESCRECTREAEALEALAAPLRKESPDDSIVDELHVRRERKRLLAAFDRSQMISERPRRRALLVPVLAATFGVLAVLLVVGWQLRARAPEELAARASVRSEGQAVWSRHLEPDLEKVILDSGTLEIEVRPAAGDRRFLVILPDGELEDLGTTFSVSVKDGQTAQVAVREGRVLLRLRDRSAIAVGAGEVWSNAPAPALPRGRAEASSRPAESASPEPALERPVPRAPAPSFPTSNASVSSAPSSSAPASSSASTSGAPPLVPSDASLEFRAATALLGAGDHAGAAAAFAGFLRKYPRDPRGEDAAYLRVIALQRAGDAAATRKAAEDYLRRYPAGFRRTEVEGLAR
jgi:hypothetical protein